MSDEDIETSECQFDERDEDYGDGDVAESATGDVDDYADEGEDPDDDNGVEDEDVSESDDESTEGRTNGGASSIGMITDLETCRLCFLFVVQKHTCPLFFEVLFFWGEQL